MIPLAAMGKKCRLSWHKKRSDLLNCQGTLKWENGDRYEGELNNGKMHGNGVFSWANGDVYEGDFKDSKMHGMGKWKWADKNMYEGELKCGKKHGKGSFKMANGNQYEGDWKEDNKHGNGTFMWASGSRYDGGWKNDEAFGTGIMEYADGNRYEGFWQDSKRHGNGTMKSVNKECSTKEMYVYDIYDGEWKEDNRHGKGTLTRACGDMYKGEWKDNKMKDVDGNMHEEVYTEGDLVSSKPASPVASPFFTKLMEMEAANQHVDDGVGLSEILSELPPLVEDVHTMKLTYTIIATCYRMGALEKEKVKAFIYEGLKKASESCTGRDALVIYKLILDKAYTDGYITRDEQIGLDNDAEIKRIENAHFIKSMMEAIRLNTQRIECLEENVVSINDSVNKIKAGLKRKMKVESAVGFVCAIANLFSFGVGGTLINSVQCLVMDSVIDFGDLDHIMDKVVEKGGPDSDTSSELLNELMDIVVGDFADKKLEAAIKKQNTLVVVSAVSCMVSNKYGDGGEPLAAGYMGEKKNTNGDNAFHAGNFIKAIKALNDANIVILLSPNLFDGYYQKGLALHTLKRYDDAISVFEHGLKQCPSNDCLEEGLNNVRIDEKYKKYLEERKEGESVLIANKAGIDTHPQHEKKL